MAELDRSREHLHGGRGKAIQIIHRRDERLACRCRPRHRSPCLAVRRVLHGELPGRPRGRRRQREEGPSHARRLRRPTCPEGHAQTSRHRHQGSRRTSASTRYGFNCSMASAATASTSPKTSTLPPNLATASSSGSPRTTSRSTTLMNLREAYRLFGEDSEAGSLARQLLGQQHWYASIAEFDPRTGEALPLGFDTVLHCLANGDETTNIRDRLWRVVEHSRAAVERIFDSLSETPARASDPPYPRRQGAERDQLHRSQPSTRSERARETRRQALHAGRSQVSVRRSAAESASQGVRYTIGRSP